ncbi:alpha/beta fold hydrolase [Brevundimonas sp.]|uniref:alpha/beta hydrolase family protein n=1 Tax=Brevundimonas sp. TaxID=1871086 RepID=UPI001AC39339|nr:alpha/beta fold hydrolase [Brevundimonas sp.]MBN9466369.1 S9 family peptidase [Brevundimonas sp.]
MDLSPDGKHLAALISPDGAQRIIAIWDTSDMAAAPYLIGSDPRSEPLRVSFIKNDRLFVTTQQLVDFTLGGSAERSFRSKTAVLDLRGNPVRMSLQFDGLTSEQQQFVGVGGLVSSLPRDPQNIIVRDPVRGDLYQLNLYTGRAERRERGSSRFSGDQADLNGEIRARSEFNFDNGAAYIAQWIKSPDTGEWAEHFRWYARDRQPVSIAGFSNDPNIIFVQSSVDRDHAAIYEYNIRERKMGEIAFAHPVFNAEGVIRSTSPADFGEVVGFSYQGEKGQVYWTDPVMEAAQTQFRQALGVHMRPLQWIDIATGRRVGLQVPEDADISMSAVSDDRKIFVVRKSGPMTPPEYYLVKNGQVALLGRAYPELANAPLGPTSLIQYEARDGLTIPAFLTKPDPEVYGPGPYPTIITPHGGPWSRDNLDWDASAWTQYFAARGFAVLRPQFRGSEGWGQRLWRAGDREWGRKMQDDLDDGVRYLIAQGITIPDRVALHGYSYGGYTAMMAAVRPNGLYQCAAAGAGPATIDLFKKGTYGSRYLREFQNPTADGEDPLRRVNEVSIPIYLYSGDRDTTVVPAESRAFAAALERAGKPYKLNILPDMAHTLNTWTPANYAAILTTVEDFFKNDCGPGGL